MSGSVYHLWKVICSGGLEQWLPNVQGDFVLKYHDVTASQVFGQVPIDLNGWVWQAVPPVKITTAIKHCVKPCPVAADGQGVVNRRLDCLFFTTPCPMWKAPNSGLHTMIQWFAITYNAITVSFRKALLWTNFYYFFLSKRMMGSSAKFNLFELNWTLVFEGSIFELRECRSNHFFYSSVHSQH